MVIVSGVTTVFFSGFVGPSDTQLLTGFFGVVVTVCGFVGWARCLLHDK
jgi:hypothetical protein